MAVSRKALVSILGKLEIEHNTGIPVKRAQKKLERHLSKNKGALDEVKFSPKELATLEALGVGAKKAKSKKSDDSDEKPAKKGKKKSSSAEVVKAPKGNEGFIRKLVKKGKSKDEIKKAFFKRYEVTGRDEKFVQKRFNIYYSLATGGKDSSGKKSGKKEKAVAAKKSSKKSDKKASSKSDKKSSKKDAKAKKPAKAAKKSKKASKDEEE